MAEKIVSIDLGRRTEPQQKRALERIEAIIDATLDLLDRLPVSEVTTSAVAREAGIPVGSIYRYYPNIYAIYGTIFDRFHEETRLILATAEAARTGGWKSKLEADLTAMAKLLESKPSYRAVILLTFSAPQLSAIREKWNHQFAENFAAGWREGGDGFAGSDPYIVARMVVEIYSAAQLLILRHWNDKAKRKSIAHERMVALERYLAAYLD